MKILITALIAATFLIFSCGKNQRSAKDELGDKLITQFENSDKEETNKKFFSDSTGIPQASATKNKQPTPANAPANPDWDKKIIKVASLNLEVKDYNNYYSFLREKVKSVGGYIAQEEQNQSDYKIENTLQIKVPVDQFDNAVVLLTTNIKKLNEKKISSQDVTTEFVDTKSRIESKKQVRLRYMDLLHQAKNMEEILSVQSEINNVQEQIESGLGRIEYLSHSSVFSTINLTYYHVLNSSAKDDNKPSFGTKLSSAFKNGWNWMGEVFVGLVSIWPLFLLVFIAILIYKKFETTKPKQV